MYVERAAWHARNRSKDAKNGRQDESGKTTSNWLVLCICAIFSAAFISRAVVAQVKKRSTLLAKAFRIFSMDENTIKAVFGKEAPWDLALTSDPLLPFPFAIHDTRLHFHAFSLWTYSYCSFSMINEFWTIIFSNNRLNL